jgi:hypothetical protein
LIIQPAHHQQKKLTGEKLFARFVLFLPKITHMSQKRKYRGAAWLVFLLSLGALALAIVSHWPWLTLILPFVATSFVWAMDIV